MAERFLEDIYQDAIIIEQLREYLFLADSENDLDSRAKYNKAAAGIERILPKLEDANRELAKEIETTAIAIRDSFNDKSKATAIVESVLIPLLFSYMSYFGGIEATENKYTIKSTQSGFLSICDNELKMTLHSTYDPMWEAFRVASSIFDADVQRYYILGCGLGYLPYQLWMRSEGAVKIVIYEEDENILSYAKKFGVLSWIPDNCLEIYCCSDIEKVADKFLHDVDGFDRSDVKYSLYISPWKKEIYKKILQGRIAVLDANISLERSMQQRTSINLWKNYARERYPFDTIKDKFSYEEWLVVSAGPSLDEQIEFLRDCKGKRGIIAVNTVVRRLFNEGIPPDLIVAVDQYVQMREHIEGIEDKTIGIPLFADWRLNWQYADLYRGPISFISIGARDFDPEGKGIVWQASGSVSGVALEAAVHLGANRVYFVGQDLAYPDGKAYALGMPHIDDAASFGTMFVKAVDGGVVPTSEAFNWFRMGLENQITRYNNVEFFNLSKHGALIKGCKNI